MKEIAPGVFWDNERPFYEQTPEAQEIIDVAMHNAPTAKETERCDAANSRLVWGVYSLPKGTIKVTINYMASSTSNEWAGIRNKEYYAE